MEAEDLIAAVFPDQLACAENLAGEREIPDHPLVNQTIADCLTEAMDIDGLERLLQRIESGRDSHRRPRSDRAVAARARSAVGAALRLSRRCAAGRAPHPGGDGPALARARRPPPISAGSIPRRSRACATKPGPIRPTPTNCTMRWSGSASSPPTRSRRAGLGRLARRARRRQRRVTRLTAAGAAIWVAAERLPQFQALWPDAALSPAIAAPAAYAGEELVAATTRWSRSCAAGSKGLGPVDAGRARRSARA